MISTTFLFGLACATVAVVYAVVLPESETPLNRWFAWLHSLYEEGGWRSWLAAPLGACCRCCAGQIGLWASSMITPWSLDAWSIGIHLLAACSAVLFAATLNSGYRWLMKQI